MKRAYRITFSLLLALMMFLGTMAAFHAIPQQKERLYTPPTLQQEVEDEMWEEDGKQEVADVETPFSVMVYAIGLAIGLGALSYTLTGKKLRLHHTAFWLVLSVGLVMAVLCRGNIVAGWDEQEHLDYTQQLATLAEGNLRAFADSFSMWYFGYLPYALGMGLMNLLGLAAYGEVAGVMVSTILYALLTALTVWQAPKYKMVFLVVLSLPTAIFQSAVYTYDATVIVTVALALAMILRELSDKNRPITSNRMVLMTLLLCMGTLAKPAYFVCLLLLFLLPQEKFGSAKRLWIMRGMVLVLLIMSLGSMALNTSYDGVKMGDSRFAGTDAKAQLQWMLSHPMDFLRVLGGYVRAPYDNLFIEAGASYAYKGGIPGAGPWLVLLALLVAPLCAVGESSPSLLTGRRRMAFLCLSQLPVFALVITQFVVSSPVGGSTIIGVQPRYTLPIFIPTALCIAGPEELRKLFANKAGRVLTTLIVLGLYVLHAYGLWGAFIRL